jgi:predicted HTH transcriptional regulator
MATVKPYIITVKYIAVYADPAPTADQIAAELNIDATEILIEEAVVSAKPKHSTKPVEEIDVESRTIRIYDTPPSVPVKPVVDGDLNLYGLERNGTSEKVLRALKVRGPLTVKQLKEVTKLKSPNINVTVNRLKKMSKIKVVGQETYGSIYGIVE